MFNLCFECGTSQECKRRQACMLAGENSPMLSNVMPLTPKDWRNAPNITYRFGAIEVTGHCFGQQRWFKTRKAALTYARVSFQHFAVADYWER